MPSVKPFEMSGSQFSMRKMKEKGVAIVPGEIFGSYSNDMLRISYATSIEKLEEAMNRIEVFIEEL